MCSQTVCLLAAALERQGVATVAIVLLREIAERVRAPRALWVPFAHGYPLGRPHDAAIQHRVIARALQMIEDERSGPVLRDFDDQPG